MKRLVVYNIKYCEGASGKWWEYLKLWRYISHDKKTRREIAASLKEYKPDILSLVEVDTGSVRAKARNHVLYFKEALGMDNYVERVKYPLESWLKLLHYVPIMRKQANAVITREKVEEVKYHYLNHGTKRVVIETTLKLPQKISLLTVHLALGRKKRKKQLEDLTNIIKNIENPVILVGDFNTLKGEKELQELIEKTKLDHKYYVNRFISTHTFPSHSPKKTLDYILTSEKIKVKNYEVLNIKYSDHLPIMIDFEIE